MGVTDGMAQQHIWYDSNSMYWQHLQALCVSCRLASSSQLMRSRQATCK